MDGQVLKAIGSPGLFKESQIIPYSPVHILFNHEKTQRRVLQRDGTAW